MKKKLSNNDFNFSFCWSMKNKGFLSMLGINIVIILIFSLFIFKYKWDKVLLIPEIIDIQHKLVNSIKDTSDIVVQIITEDNTTYYQEDSFEENTLIDKQTLQKKWNWIILSKKWYILTNSHVVDKPNLTYTVITSDNRNFVVKNIWKDELLDLAILSIGQQNSLSEATFVDIDAQIDVGTFVFSVGNPLSEYPNTVSFWIISGKWRNLLTTPSNNTYYAGFYQTDAALNPGNSWWPLLNLSGEVIAMITAISRGGNNIWFALPLNNTFIKATIDILDQNNNLIRPYLGISYTDNSSWALVDTIYVDSPAQNLLFAGDLILSIDKRNLSLSSPLLYYLYTYKPNDTIILSVMRDNKIISIPVVLWHKTL